MRVEEERMKESGMDKLIELLDEYRKQNPREFFGDDGSLVVLTGKDFIELNRLIIISKEYGFIQRLVKNDKIDRDKSKTITAKTEIMLATNYNNGVEVRKRYWVYEQLLMLLSISDTPIEDLISYLKIS